MAYENFEKFVRYLRGLQEANLFPIIAVTGTMGSGKTSFSMQAAIKYHELYLDKPFNVEHNIAYDNNDVVEKYYSMEEMNQLIADEAARFAMSEDWNRAENKELKKITAQLRPRRLVFYMNIPNFTWLDRKYKSELVRLWVWVPTRGYAVIFKPDDNPGSDDRWHMKEMRKWKYSVDQFTPIETIYNLVSPLKSFFDIVKFPKVPEDVYARYLNLRDKKTFREPGEGLILQKDMGKVMAYNFYTNYNKIMEQIQASKFKRPTHRLVAKLLTHDPVKKIQLAGYVTVRSWVNEIKKKVPAEVQLDLKAADYKELPEAEV